jgi:hypothetical protein
LTFIPESCSEDYKEGSLEKGMTCSTKVTISSRLSNQRLLVETPMLTSQHKKKKIWYSAWWVSYFYGKKRITTYTQVFKMDSTNVKIFCVVNESFEKK